MDRTETITARLSTSFRDELGCRILVASAEDWLLMPLEQSYRFGWMPPVQLTADRDHRLIPFSPELIAKTTEWITDDDVLDHYLATIELFVATYAWRSATDSHETIARALEDQLYDNDREDHLRLMSEIELRALDAGIVTPR